MQNQISCIKIIFVVLISFIPFWVSAQGVMIKDVVFKAMLMDSLCVDTDDDDIGDRNVDTNNNRIIEEAEVLSVKRLILKETRSYDDDKAKLSSLVGIKSFKNLAKLICSMNLIDSLDLKGLDNLEHLSCESNSLKLLDIRALPNLKYLNCSDNQLETLVIDNCYNLEYIDCYQNGIISLSTGNLTKLEHLECQRQHKQSNGMEILQLGKHPKLKKLDCSGNSISSINLDNIPNVEILHINIPHIEQFEFPSLLSLRELDCEGDNNEINKGLDLRNLKNLEHFSCGFSIGLENLNIKGLSNLKKLSISICYALESTDFLNDQYNLKSLAFESTNITSLNVEHLRKLKSLICSNNPNLSYLSMKNGHSGGWDYVKIHTNPKLKYIYCNPNEVRGLQKYLRTVDMPDCVVVPK